MQCVRNPNKYFPTKLKSRTWTSCVIHCVVFVCPLIQVLSIEWPTALVSVWHSKLIQSICTRQCTSVPFQQKASHPTTIACESASTTQPTALHCFAFEVWWRFGFLVGWGYFSSSDTGKQSGEKLNPAASCIQWVKWWSIHSGQDAAAPQFNPCSKAIRTTAIPQWSLLLTGCSCNIAVWETISVQLTLMFTLLVLSSNRNSGKILGCIRHTVIYSPLWVFSLNLHHKKWLN